MNEETIKELPKLWTAIGHEIRTPLNVIKGMADISEMEIYDVELVKDCLSKINESTERMQQVTNSLIDYAAILQNNIEIQKEKIDFKTMITEIAMHSYLLAKQKQCHFNMHIQDVSEEALLGDEARISQVLLALLNIVVQYTASDGVIDFTVQQTGISNAGVFMRFRLRSTALEFPEEIVRYLNDKASYSDPNRLTPVGTFGITEMNALYFSYIMGGNIQALSRPGDYSEIIFDMEFGRTEQPYSTDGTKLFAHQNILIVADTKEVCDERGKMLIDMGMQYDSAIKHDEVLEKIGEAESNNKPFTIAIIDWDMMNQKCTQLLQDIREIFGMEMTILVTAHDPAAHQKAARHYGANLVIDRTIFRSTLFDALISIEKGIQMQRNVEKQEAYNFQGNRVLVAEDVSLNMEVITKLLSRVNIEVTCVENGMEAVARFEKKPAGYFGVIFLDINMPVMDGYEATAQIRNSRKLDAKTVPIYAMTANAFKEDVQKALETGMDGHIAKPIDVNALYRILNKVLDKKEENKLEQLRDLAELDPLTKCLNRRGFEKRISEYMQSGIYLAYIAIDIDDFKQVNDSFGHDVGDEILKKVVRVLRQKFRETDFMVRFGGDEFAIVLENYKKSPNFIMQRMDEVNDTLLHPHDGLPPITISAGAVISTDGYKTELYSSADKALYRSKNVGKGTCTVFDDVQTMMTGEEENENVLYTENIHHLNNQLKVLVDKKQQIRSDLMVKNKPVGFVTGFCEKNCPIYSFNGFFPELLGYTMEEFCTTAIRGFDAFVHPNDKEYLMDKAMTEKIRDEKIHLRNKAGDYLWFNMDYIITRTKDNREFWMASFKNINDYYVGSLCADDFRMVALIDPEQDGIVVEKGAYLLSEKELHIQKKYNYTSLINEATRETVRENDREVYLEKASLENVIRRLAADGVYEFTVYQKYGTNEYNAVRHKYRYMNAKKKQILCTWEFLGQRAEMDELTGALNETGFYRATEEILKTSSGGDQFSVLNFNISGFKAWNSMLGGENADTLLKLIVGSIRKSELEPLTICRLFSDHFVCLVDRTKLKLSTVSRLCSSQFEIDGNNVSVQMRCGIFHVEDVSESVRSMCDKAKLAKAQIENEHAIPYYIFDHTLTEKYMQQKQVLNQVGHALERKEFQVYYQPIVDAKTAKIEEAEALIRWILPGGLAMSPGLFIPALEEQGHIADVDSYVQSTVCAMIQRRHEEGQNIVPVSVNVSRMDFLNTEFVNKLKNLVTTMKETPQYMRIEVTESSYTEVGKPGENLLKSLREQGVKILMDDFGIGFSTLSGITSQQFDMVKIDMSFIRGLGKNNGSEAVIQNVIAMCHALNMKVVAEGVETEAQYQFLLSADCDYLQGFYFYKPMPEEDFEKLLNNTQNEGDYEIAMNTEL